MTDTRADIASRYYLKNREKIRAQMREYMRRRRALWKSAGFCIRCGKVKAALGHVNCGVCE